MESASREAVRQRAAGACEYCRRPQTSSEFRFHIEHIIPRVHGGRDGDDNLALACPACNLYKGPNLAAVDPETRQTSRLYHPRTDEWATHFAFRDARIVGLTPIGRATVNLLLMNDPTRLRVRQMLLRLGELR